MIANRLTANALVKQARLDAGLTQAELARRASTTQSVIARLETPGANPQLSTLEKVIAATGNKLNLELYGDAGIDETLIAGSLRESPAQRLAYFESLYGFAKKFGGRAFSARSGS